MTAATVLVTGAAGFIGSTLVDRLLEEGRRVVGIDDLSSGALHNLHGARRRHAGRFEFQRLDITSGGLPMVVERHRPDVILHLAAQVSVTSSVRDPLRDADVNVLGTIRVLEAARRSGVRKVVVATSGGALYGDPTVAELPVDEHRPPRPASPYGMSKLAAEGYLQVYGDLHDVDWSALALANVYGPRQDSSGEGGVVAVFAERMLTGRPCTIHGDGHQTRDFVFVDDVVHALVLAMTRGGRRRYHIGTGQRTSVNDLFAELASAAGYGLPAIHGPARPGELRHSALDARLAARELGWKPWTPLLDGITATMAWARTELAAVR